MGIFNKLKKLKTQKDEKEATVAKAVKGSEADRVVRLEKPLAPKDKKEKDQKKELVLTKKEDKPKEAKTWANKDLHGVLVKPLITEKANYLTGSNQYVFKVEVSANKIQVAQAIESRYGVKPLSINILNNKGKKVRYGRTSGQTKNWKKAIITFPAGKSIEIQEGV
ncbi:MAG: 50S ribosomal protein L23 [Patescibacteria group bacterium]